MTGAWLLANDLKQISDCTGGRKGDAVRYCQSERIISFYYEESNVSVWNTPRGNQDVPAGEGVPEIS